MLESLAGLCTEGSELVLDYADERLFQSDARRVQCMIQMASAGGEPMVSCYDEAELEALLGRYGFLVYEENGPEEINRTLLSGSGLTAFEHIHYVTAVYKP